MTYPMKASTKVATKAATKAATKVGAARGPWVMVGWMSAIIGVIVVVFLVTSMSKDPEGRAEEKIPATAQ